MGWGWWMRGLTAAILLAGQAGAAAPQPWREATSTHFVIYSQESEPSLRAYAEKLERFDGALRYLFPGAAGETISADRLTIYVLPTDEAVRAAMGETDSVAAGVYAAHAAGSIALTSRNNGGDHSIYDLTAQITLLHEYAHHFMLHNFAAAYPRWFIEGSAEFTSTASFQPDGGVGIGLPAAHRARELHLNDQLSFQQLVRDDLRRMNGVEFYSLYGRGWLLTHYLSFDPARAGQLQRYLALINEGKTPAQAAAAFGDPVKFERDLQRYLARPKLSYVVVPASVFKTGEIKIRDATAAENAYLPIQMRSHYGVSRRDAQRLVPAARAAAAPFSNDAGAQCMLAEAEDDAHNYDQADDAASRALTAAPDAYCALLYKGIVAMDRAHAAGAKADDPAWRAARGWFIKANHADVEQPWPMFLYYRTYGLSGAKPTTNAVEALSGSAARAPQDEEVRLIAAVQYLRDEQPAAAKLMLAPAANSAHGGKFANAIGAVYERIGQDPPAMLATKLETALQAAEGSTAKK